MGRKIFAVFFCACVIFLGVAAVFAQMEMEDMPPAKGAVMTKAGLCPITAAEGKERFSYTYKGQNYYFCCQMCLLKFKKDPETYISRIKTVTLEVSQRGFSPNPLRIKKGDIVRLAIVSPDTSHGVAVKEYGVDVMLEKGEVKKLEFFASKEGKFDILCTVNCGSGPSQIKGTLLVEAK